MVFYIVLYAFILKNNLLIYVLSYFVKNIVMRKSVVLLLSFILSCNFLFAQKYRWEAFINKDEITAILPVGEQMWIGSSKGIWVCDVEGKIIKDYNDINDTLVDVSAMDIDLEGNVWVGTKSGLFKYDGVNWKSFTEDNSFLNHDIILSVYCDSFGNVWVSTNSYIFKFNGVSWEEFYIQVGPTLSGVKLISQDRYGDMWGVSRVGGKLYKLVNDSWVLMYPVSGQSPSSVNAIEFDEFDNVWIGTESNGLIKLTGSNLVDYTISNSELKDNFIRSLKLDLEGNLWIGTYRGGVSVLTDQTLETKTLEVDSIIASNDVRSIEVDFEGNVWLGTSKGISKKSDELWEFVLYSSFGPSMAAVTAIDFDSKGTMWCGSFDGNLSEYDGNTWRNYSSFNSDIPSGGVTTLSIDKADNIWFSSGDNGLSRFDGNNWITYTSQNSGLLNDNIKGIASDIENNIWVSSSYGLSKFDGQNWEVYTEENSEIPNHNINAIVCDTLGNLWVGTSEGLAMYDGTNWINYAAINSIYYGCGVYSLAFDKFGQLYLGTSCGLTTFSESSPRNSHRDDYISNVSVDVNGHVWYEMLNEYKLYRDRSGGGTEWFQLHPNENQAFIRTIASDSEGDIWVATTLGLFRSTWETIPKYWIGANQDITCIAKAENGVKWIGTRDGLLRYDGKEYVKYITENSGLSDNYINCIFIDHNDKIWIGTESGVSIFDGETWDEKLSTSNILSIVLNEDEDLWIGTDRKLYRFNPGTGGWFSVTSSVFGTSFPKINELKYDKHGILWVGSDRGLRKFTGGSGSIFDLDNWHSFYSSEMGVGSNVINSIEFDAEDNLWVGTQKGIAMFNRTTWTSHYTAGVYVPRENVSSMTIDNNGDLWVGTNYYGLYKYNGDSWSQHNYEWSTNEFSSDMVTGLLEEDGVLTVAYDGLGLAEIEIEDIRANFKRVSGRVYFDKNQNKQKDADELYLLGHKLQWIQQNQWFFTNEEGKYEFLVDSGSYINIKYFPTNFYSATEDTRFSNVITDNIELPEIGVYAPDRIAYKCGIVIGRSRCDTETIVTFTYNSMSTNSGPVSIDILYDSSLSIISSEPMYDSLSNNHLYYSIDNFVLGSSENIQLLVQNPDYTQMGKSLKYETNLSIEGYSVIVKKEVLLTCSYDPNDKTVYPLPVGEENYTLKGDTLNYVLRFQNTGNDTAYHVMLKDSLDINLNIETFEVLGSSHKVNTSINEDGIVRFDFFDIMLPDSISNEEESNGFVSYKIVPYVGLEDNTIINNTAHIFFDQNPSLTTNTTVNRLVSEIPSLVVGINEYDGLYQSVVPNPLQETSQLRFNNLGSSTIRVLDLSGRLIFEGGTSEDYYIFNREDFPRSGMYFYYLESKGVVETGKIMVK